LLFESLKSSKGQMGVCCANLLLGLGALACLQMALSQHALLFSCPSELFLQLRDFAPVFADNFFQLSNFGFGCSAPLESLML
jgi:hypothetical protein